MLPGQPAALRTSAQGGDRRWQQDKAARERARQAEARADRAAAEHTRRGGLLRAARAVRAERAEDRAYRRAR